MLKHPTFDQLNALGLFSMAKAFEELQGSDAAKALDNIEWLGLLLDRETTFRKEKRLITGHWPPCVLPSPLRSSRMCEAKSRR